MSQDIAAIDAFLTATSDERIEELQELLRIPSVTVLSEHRNDVRAAAGWIADHMRALGLEHVEVCETGGHPIVYADWLNAPGAPTVIVYAHYDVQPVDPLDLWIRPPFEPRIADGRVYGRGAADDKGQVHLHIWAARAWLETHGRLPVNVRYVIEGEEEAGSPNFESWLEANRHRLDADLIVVSDTGFAEGNHPAVTIGLRGNVALQIDVTGARQDLHSGTFGGLVQNPANALVRILSSLRDGEGRVTVPGFHDGIRELGSADLAAFDRVPFDEASFAEGIGVPELFGEPGFAPLARRGARPTLDICGIWSGFQGEGTKTIIPAHAHAKISARIVPDQDAQHIVEVLRDAILAVDVPGVRVEVTLQDTMRPFAVDIDHRAARLAARCLQDVFGSAPYYLREGGSIGAVASFDAVVGAPIVLLGFTNPDENAHAPNESLVIANYEGGIRTVARYWEALAASPAREDAA
jgi:acetylornithine deacetylase/succinyl-diaminopimelate desuccinylase-like protein